MWSWITKLAGSGVFAVFGEDILQPLLSAWAQSKNIDLAEMQAAAGSMTTLAGQVLAANVQTSAQRIAYATSLLSWWPFRIILLVLMLPPAMHFAAIMLDSTLPFHWGIAKVPPPYDGYEREFILFFIVAKPVDSLIGSVGAALTTWLGRGTGAGRPTL
jgi:hypothetical protein